MRPNPESAKITFNANDLLPAAPGSECYACRRLGLLDREASTTRP